MKYKLVKKGEWTHKITKKDKNKVNGKKTKYLTKK